MPNKRSALKAHRVSERRYARNRPIRSSLRTYVKRARAELSGTFDGDAAEEAVRLAAKRLDMAASKGVIHKNQAARRKSRLMHQLFQLQQAPPVAETPTTTRGRARRTSGTTKAAGTAKTAATRSTRTKK